ncbi:cupin-like domain-containing protein [Sphingomonas sp.]|uniref:cupin-like domain-containing protein n=2 Tax=unclassified Sphingomonas TaxID=196159 RepID=UPI00257967CD|nr:cupin-like domain-containing protein [Sphingomonas sp.]
MTIAVPEIAADPFADPAQFREIAARCEPVVVRGLVNDWPVVRAAATSPVALRAYLLRFASATRAEAFVGKAGRYSYNERLDGFDFDRVDTDLADALDRILASANVPGAPTVYVGSLDTAQYLPGFAAENNLGPLLSTVQPRLWIGNRSDIACHNDTFDNIACVVSGRRRFTLYPPQAVADLHIGPVDFTMSGRATSLATSASAEARATVAELEAGDALYLPKLWWHRVEATGSINLLVNYWWDEFSAGPDAPNTAMMLAMIAIAERPPAERAAWRALFDHYVFRPDGHPLRHIPEERHGILGPLAVGNYGRIRAMVMQMLRGG